ncbi:hypothetical protein C8R45DRAFT_1111072 [Mycena sanguinolenta]|nr:hypothetical protein C8R45DRAFT_1111072 [Mycena sanguinolenta]
MLTYDERKRSVLVFNRNTVRVNGHSAPNEPPFARGSEAPAPTAHNSSPYGSKPWQPQQQRQQDACSASLPQWQAVNALVFAARTRMVNPPPWHPSHPGRHLSTSSFGSNSGQKYGRGEGGANGRSARHCTQRMGSQGSDCGHGYRWVFAPAAESNWVWGLVASRGEQPLAFVVAGAASMYL